MEGYSSILYRLSGVLPFHHGSPGEDLDILKQALSAYYFSDAMDETTHGLVWDHFVIPSLLLVLQGHLSSDPHRVRLNEYFYREFSVRVPQSAIQEESVIGLIAVMIDAGSVPNAVMEHLALADLVYSIFPGLDDFMSRVSPGEGVFIFSPIFLVALSRFLSDIQVFTILSPCYS